MISERLLAIVRCPECRGRLSPPERAEPANPGSYRCTGCGRVFPGGDYLDVRPLRMFEEQTKYLDEALHADARHERVSAPLLGSRIRNGMLRRFLAPRPGDLVADLGCGSGRAILWNRDLGADFVGVDIAPFFSREARAQVDLMLGDLRTLPFADATFDKAWSLDVLEHLSPEALDGMLAEAARVLKPGGALFVYTHVRKNARIAMGLRWINRFAQWLDRRGIVDLRQEHLRKSDHLNPLRDIPHLEQVAEAAGFRIGRIRYYTPIVGGFVENILVRAAEKALATRARARTLPAPRLATDKNAGTGSSGGTETNGTEEAEEAAHASAVRKARAAAKARIASRGPTYFALRAVSFVMKLDLLLFGRIRSGPFFALLVKK